MMTTWLLVPVKSLTEGKRRLRPILSEAARQRFNKLLLTHMLDAASGCPRSLRTAVISECAGVLDVAAQQGMLPIRQAAGGSLNDALGQGMEVLRNRGADAILVVAADLPLVTTDDLMSIADRGEGKGELIIWTDKHRSGTNALYLPPNVALRFQFGPDSCAAHLHQGIVAAGAASVEIHPRIAFDIDTPEDFRRWYCSLDAAGRDALACLHGGGEASLFEDEMRDGGIDDHRDESNAAAAGFPAK